MLTAQEGRLSSDADASLNRPRAALRLKSLRGIAVCASASTPALATASKPAKMLLF